MRPLVTLTGDGTFRAPTPQEALRLDLPDDPHLAAWAKSLGAELVVADLGVRDGSARHDPLRLASAYANIMGVQPR